MDKITTIIEAKKDLFNGGKCFTKGKQYEVKDWNKINSDAELMEKQTINDMGEPHFIGSWWRDFEIVRDEEENEEED